MLQVEEKNNIFEVTFGEAGSEICDGWVSRMLGAIDGIERSLSTDSAVVITGTNKYFCNGLNLTKIQLLSEQGIKQLREDVAQIHYRIQSMPVPWIAAINGHAFGAGALLAMSCDIRLQSKGKGWFCFPEVDIGVPMVDEMMFLLEQKLSKQTLHQALLTGKRYTAEQARDAGLVDIASEADNLMEEALFLAAELGRKNKGSYGGLKLQLNSKTIQRLKAV